MRADVKQMWIDALRSGDYDQGRANLLDLDDPDQPRWTVLGVLCALAVRHSVPVKTMSYEEAITTGFQTYDDSRKIPPTSVLEWAGDGTPISQDAVLLLYALNWKLSFEDLADLIEVAL